MSETADYIEPDFLEFRPDLATDLVDRGVREIALKVSISPVAKFERAKNLAEAKLLASEIGWIHIGEVTNEDTFLQGLAEGSFTFFADELFVDQETLAL